MNIKKARISMVIVALALPTLALAHVGSDGGVHHGFMAGFTHPFTGLDHLLAMLLIGVCSAALGRRSWYAPVAFVAMLVVGALLAAAGLPVPSVEPAIAVSLVVLGVLLAARTAWPAAMVTAVAVVFALFHGAAHGVELQGLAALGGMALATAVLHATGLLAGLRMRRHSVWWPRIAGASVSLFGAALLFGVA